MATSDLRAARDFLRRQFPNGGRVLCAVSGGLDSMCLVHFLDTWGRKNDFFPAAAHFNHRLRGEAADRDQRFVEAWCAGRGIPCFSGSDVTQCRTKRPDNTAQNADQVNPHRSREIVPIGYRFSDKRPFHNPRIEQEIAGKYP